MTVEPSITEPEPENEKLNLLRYRSMLMDSEEKFKKASDDKISTSLFAGDKFYNLKKQANVGKPAEEKNFNPNMQLLNAKSRSKSPIRDQRIADPDQKELVRIEAMQSFINQQAYHGQRTQSASKLNERKESVSKLQKSVKNNSKFESDLC